MSQTRMKVPTALAAAAMTITAAALMTMTATAALAEDAATAAGTAAAPATTPPPAAAPKVGASHADDHSKPLPSPHRKSDVGTLKVANKQARTFTLDCETCAPDTKNKVYKAPAAMNLHALDGKRVRVTFDTLGNVQTVHRIDANRHVSMSKKEV